MINKIYFIQRKPELNNKEFRRLNNSCRVFILSSFLRKYFLMN